MSRLALSLTLALTACGTLGSGEEGTPTSTLQDVVEASATPESTEASEPGQRRNLVLSITPLIPGDSVSFTVTGANPGETIHVARSLQGQGAGPCFGTYQAGCLGILNPTLQGTVNADANGVAVLTQTLPSNLTIGTNVSFQAVAPRGTSGVNWVFSPAVDTVIADAPLNVFNMVYGDIIVSEIMQNPAAVADTDGEWFEVYNTTSDDANLAGVTITDFGNDSFTVNTNVFVPAGGRAVFARSGDPALNGGVNADYDYAGAMILGNGVDELNLVANAVIIDSVAWDDGVTFPDPVGASMTLDGRYLDADDNNAGVNWLEAQLAYGAGDLGTPGERGVSTCDPLTEVEHDGRCYYLDGSGGSCEFGYELAPQSILNTIAGDFAGLDYKTTISDNCCIWHADQALENQDWGMSTNCNSAGPFVDGPVLGGAGCNNALNTNPNQLTLCQTL